MDNFYGNQLKKYMTDPGSFSGSPGYQFALDQGLNATNRSNSNIRGSGNALMALQQYGSGLASQDYGSTLDRLGKLVGQEQNYDLGQVQNANTATRNANDFTLGQGQLANTATRNQNDFALGNDQNANTAQRNMWDYTLGGQKNANDAQNNFWNYNVNQQQNANTAARNQNDFALGNGRNAIDWFNAGTNRGTAQSNAFNNSSNNQLDWAKYYNPQPWRVG